MEIKTIALIPARYGSSRFPGKPLAKLGGKEVILHVCQRVAEAEILPIVATDDKRILECVERGGYQCVMTSDRHRSGTDRIREALDKIEISDTDVIINVQGDEPFIRARQLKALAEVFSDEKVEIATLIKKFDNSCDISTLANPNLVKVVCKSNGDAMYFSRSVIPYVRGEEQKDWIGQTDFHTHMGVYAYRPDVLKAIAALPAGELEKAESLEQLRWLEAGYNIRTVITDGESVGIDTPDDLAKAEEYLSATGKRLETNMIRNTKAHGMPRLINL